jgi:hypothetical protein
VSSLPPTPPRDWLSELIETLQKSIEQLQATTIANANEVGGVKLEVGKQAAKLDILLSQLADIQKLEKEKVLQLERQRDEREIELEKTKADHKKQIIMLIVTSVGAFAMGVLNLLSQGITPRDPRLPPIGAPYHDDAGAVPRAQSTP